MTARRCSGCRCLVTAHHDDNSCGWPCSPLGFGQLFRERVQARRRWIGRTSPLLRSTFFFPRRRRTR